VPISNLVSSAAVALLLLLLLLLWRLSSIFSRVSTAIQ